MNKHSFFVYISTFFPVVMQFLFFPPCCCLYLCFASCFLYLLNGPFSTSSTSCSPTFTFYSFPLHLLTFLLLMFLHLLLSFFPLLLPRSVYQLAHLCFHCLSRRHNIWCSFNVPRWVKELMRFTYSPLMQWRQFGTEKEVACYCI